MRGLFSRVESAREFPEFRLLLPGSVGDVRLQSTSRFNVATLKTYLAENPGLSFVAPRTGHYIVVGRWRRRSDIACVVELVAGPWERDLLTLVAESARQLGVRLLVADEESGARHREAYRALGFAPIDEIVEYEKTDLRYDVPVRRFTIRPFDSTDRDSILDVERQSFPWLWWNSSDELAYYSALPTVRLFVMPAPTGVIGYAGVTVRGTHAHLDRLAVGRAYQRQGRGAALVSSAIDEARRLGARTMTLTTQASNVQSQPLYRRFGFRKTPWRYRIDGLWLSRPADRAG